jgi:uncharacterized protein YecE (DUF72 family)
MKTSSPGQLRIGTSGWVYPHWRGVFYPKTLPARKWFDHYAQHFDTVEINNAFYRLPSERTVRLWAEQVPRGFLYAVKASRYLTHRKKLKDPREPLETILGRTRLLREHLGPILYQLPPRWRCNPERLRDFLRELPADLTHVFEFRDPSWYTDEIRDLLVKAKAGFCIHDMRGSVSPDWLTARVIYIRFHGPTESAYSGSYSPEQLRSWASRIRGYLKSGHDVFVYFNNDGQGHAVANARDLRTLLAG